MSEYVFLKFWQAAQEGYPGCIITIQCRSKDEIADVVKNCSLPLLGTGKNRAD